MLPGVTVPGSAPVVPVKIARNPACRWDRRPPCCRTGMPERSRSLNRAVFDVPSVIDCMPTGLQAVADVVIPCSRS